MIQAIKINGYGRTTWKSQAQSGNFAVILKALGSQTWPGYATVFSGRPVNKTPVTGSTGLRGEATPG